MYPQTAEPPHHLCRSPGHFRSCAQQLRRSAGRDQELPGAFQDKIQLETDSVGAGEKELWSCPSLGALLEEEEEDLKP